MTVRATSLVLLLWALLPGSAFAAERTGAAGPSTRAPSNFPLASDIRVGGDDAQTRMVVDFSEKIDIRAFTLPDPYRVVIDMPQVSFQLRPKTGETGRGLIKTFRYG